MSFCGSRLAAGVRAGLKHRLAARHCGRGRGHRSARRAARSALGQLRLGPVLDPIADKLFMAAAVGVVAFSGRLEPLRDRGRPAARHRCYGGLRRHVPFPPARGPFRPDPSGKAVTVAQILTLMAFLIDSPYLRPIAWATQRDRHLSPSGTTTGWRPGPSAGWGSSVPARDQAGHARPGSRAFAFVGGAPDGPAIDHRRRQRGRSRADADPPPAPRPLQRLRRGGHPGEDAGQLRRFGSR